MSQLNRRYSTDTNQGWRTPTNSKRYSEAFSSMASSDFMSPRSSSSSSRLYKVIVIGEVATGKSALIRRYVHNVFGSKSDYRATVGVDFQLKLLRYNDELDLRLQLWDIAGQERFSSMTRAYYKGAMGAIIVFDQTDSRTLTAALEKWKNDLDEKVRLPVGEKKVPAILVCNKCDLPRDPRLPDDEEISRRATEMGFVPRWFKTSAKTGDGVVDAISLMVRYIMAVDTWSPSLANPDADEVFHLNPTTPSFHSHVDGNASAIEAHEVTEQDTVQVAAANVKNPKRKAPPCLC